MFAYVMSDISPFSKENREKFIGIRHQQTEA